VSEIEWPDVTRSARGLSHAEVTRACDDAAKDAVLSDRTVISSAILAQALRRRGRMRPAKRRRRAEVR
jgi:hypothetical protein